MIVVMRATLIWLILLPHFLGNIALCVGSDGSIALELESVLCCLGISESTTKSELEFMSDTNPLPSNDDRKLCVDIPIFISKADNPSITQSSIQNHIVIFTAHDAIYKKYVDKTNESIFPISTSVVNHTLTSIRTVVLLI